MDKEWTSWVDYYMQEEVNINKFYGIDKEADECYMDKNMYMVQMLKDLAKEMGKSNVIDKMDSLLSSGTITLKDFCERIKK